ncbi:hypothetical protein ABVT39_004420 [Epinephelus coioides]
MSLADYSTMETELKEELTKFESELKAYKIKKYQRDTEDYKRGIVYNWTTSGQRNWRPCTHGGTRAPGTRAPRRQEGSRQTQRPNLLLTSEEGTSDQDHTSASSTDEAFLDRIPRRNPGGDRGRGTHPSSSREWNMVTRNRSRR